MPSFPLEVYLVFLVVLGAVLGGLTWYRHKKAVGSRTSYLSRFDPEELRMSRYKVGVVYRVMSQSDDEVCVVVVWDNGAPVGDKTEHTMPLDGLSPFDMDRFT